MKVLMFVPSGGRGAKEFRRQAELARRVAWDRDSEIYEIDHQLPRHKRAAAVLEILSNGHFDGAKWDAVAFFCHGWANGIQLGITTRNVAKFAEKLANPHPRMGSDRVLLYCCSAGDDPKAKTSSPGTGDNSVADKLRDAMCEAGLVNCRVMAHTTVGHTTTNPYVRFFDGLGSPVGGTGGHYVVQPRSKLWKVWRKRLRARGDGFRFAFPFQSVQGIHEELLGLG